MRKRTKLTAVCILILVAAMLTSCGQARTAKETMTDAYLKTAEVTTANFKSTVNMGLEIPNTQDPNLTMMAGFLSDISINMEGTTNIEGPEIQAKANLDMGGMSFDVDLYMNENTMVLYMPFASQMLLGTNSADSYMVYDLDQMYEQSGIAPTSMATDPEKMAAISTEIYGTMFAKIDEASITDKGEQTITVGEEEVKAQEIQVVILEEDLPVLIDTLMEIMQGEALREIMLEQALNVDSTMTEEQFNSELDTGLAEMKTELDAMLESVVFEDFNIQSSIFVDKDDYVIKNIIDISISVNYEGQVYQFTLQSDSENWNINQPVTIEMPELNEENSIDMNQFMTP